MHVFHTWMDSVHQCLKEIITLQSIPFNCIWCWILERTDIINLTSFINKYPWKWDFQEEWSFMLVLILWLALTNPVGFTEIHACGHIHRCNWEYMHVDIYPDAIEPQSFDIYVWRLSSNRLLYENKIQYTQSPT